MAANRTENVAKFLAENYGDPPEHPGIEEIIDDIKKASVDDLVFKSSTSISHSKAERQSNLLKLEEESGLQIPDEENRKELTPKLTYEMTLKYLARSEKLNDLMKILGERAELLKTLKNDICKHLNEG